LNIEKPPTTTHYFWQRQRGDCPMYGCEIENLFLTTPSKSAIVDRQARPEEVYLFFKKLHNAFFEKQRTHLL
tara:strand:+ start:3482 stop:3697 length:216 start_codon:yes stop_codon:yes gene_type:complete